MKTLLRSWWFAAAAVLYVGFASLRASPVPWFAWTAILGAPVVLWLTWRYTGAGRQVHDPEHLVLTDAKRAVVSGTLLFLCARTGPDGHAGFDVMANVAIGICVVAACIALASISSKGGLLAAPRATSSRDAAVMASMLWGIAATLPAIRSLVPTSVLALDPVAIDYATVTAAMASLLLLLAVTARLSYLRRLELGVSDRANASFIVSLVALLATVPALLLDIAAPDRAVPAVVGLTCVFHVWASSAADPRRVTASLRVTLAVLSFLSPVVLILAVLAQRAQEHASLYVVGAAGLSVLLGLAAARLARPLAPEQSRWLDAIAIAAEAALEPDPSDALRATLLALNPVAPGTNGRVELWQIAPPTLVYVDIAGQLHEESALLPPSVVALAEGEPERTLRADVLSAAQVRNVQAREALAYFSTRKTYSTTLLTHDNEPLGLLALPKTHRRSPLSLEECTALRRLCDRIESVLAITSTQARARQRELQALGRVTALEQENERLSAAITNTLRNHQRFAERYAQRLRPQTYSAGTRELQQQLERWGKARRALTLIVAPGLDPLSWASLFHLASPRHQGPFEVFDAATAEFEQETWEEPLRSPIATATAGTWVLLNPQALTLPQQERLARAIGSVNAATATDPALAMGHVLVTYLGPGMSFGQLPLSDSLRALFPSDSTTTIPPLAERPEDLRAAIYERTARLGMTLRNRALGVAPAALAEMLDYDWPLNDVELESTIAALVLVATGDAVTDVDLERIAFRPLQQSQSQREDNPLKNRRKPRPASQTGRPRDR